MKKYFIIVGLLGMFLILSSATASAAIIAVASPVAQIAPPVSVDVNQLQSNTQIRAFNEQQNVALGSPLSVDITTPGLYNGTSPLTPGVIAAGTVVSSHFVHFDPATDTSTSGVGISGGSIQFDAKIIGVIVLDATLDSSDGAVGATGTTYPNGVPYRGLELVGIEGDGITVGCDTVSISSLFVQGQADEFRVITGSQTCSPTGGLEGCAPKVWKKPDAANYWAGFQGNDRFNAVFGVKSSDKTLTLKQSLGKGAGAERAFMRQAVAALLNSTSSIVNYAYTEAQVKSIVKNTYNTKNFKASRIDLASQNSLGCILSTTP